MGWGPARQPVVDSRAMRIVGALVVALALGLAEPPGSAAQGLDSGSAAALDATIRMLQDPAQRGAAIAGNPQAAAVDAQMQAVLTTPELRDEFFALAADIFAEVAQAAGGDAGKMGQALEAGRSDPGRFLAALSPRTQERLRVFSAKIAERMR
jgi:hypothetical protein